MQKIKPKWLAVNGVPDFDGEIIRQTSSKPLRSKKNDAVDTTDESKKDSKKIDMVLLRSDLIFEDGEISCEFWIDNPDNKLQFRLGATDKNVTFAGLNMQNGAYGIVQRDEATSTENYIQDTASPDAPPPINKWVSLKIRVQGSLIELHIDDVRIARLQAQFTRAPLELVMRGIGKTQVRNLIVSAEKPQVFIVMQFTEEYNHLYREVIMPVCIEFGYEVIRADNIYTNSLIVEDIAQSIRGASLVIADVTPNNANVYYEVGFAHGIQKPTILLSDRKREKLPFDISGFRLIFYDNSIAGKSEVETALRKHLSALRS